MWQEAGDVTALGNSGLWSAPLPSLVEDLGILWLDSETDPIMSLA